MAESMKANGARKKAYAAPSLVRYGSIAKLTLKSGKNPDAGGGKNNPTKN